MKKIIIFMLAFVIFITSNAQDSIAIKNIRFQNTVNNKWVQLTAVSLPIIATGVISQVSAPKYQYYPNRGDVKNTTRYSDVLMFTPGVVMLGLKACGVESRNSWGRLVVSDAFGAALTVGAAYAIKEVVNEGRPDESDSHSFVSAHAAISFAAATMMSKEYGWRSPWYTIGAYTMASAVSLTRVIDNRHWVGDVVAGAGVGIFTAQLGYCFADMIFKDKGLSSKYNDEIFIGYDHAKSYFGTYNGITIPFGSVCVGNNMAIKQSVGFTSALTGTYFWNNHFGVGATVGATSSSLYAVTDDNTYLNPMNTVTVSVGPRAYIPLSNYFGLECKADVGYAVNDMRTVTEYDINCYNGLASAVSCGANMYVNHNFALRADVAYNVNKIKYEISNMTPLTTDKNMSGNKWQNSLSLSLSANVLF